MAYPSGSVRMTCQRACGSAAAVRASSRAWPAVMGPIRLRVAGPAGSPVRARQEINSSSRPRDCRPGWPRGGGFGGGGLTAGRRVTAGWRVAAGWWGRVAGGRGRRPAEERGDLGGGAGDRRPGDRRAGGERAIVSPRRRGIGAARIVGRARVGRARSSGGAGRRRVGGSARPAAGRGRRPRRPHRRRGREWPEPPGPGSPGSGPGSGQGRPGPAGPPGPGPPGPGPPGPGAGPSRGRRGRAPCRQGRRGRLHQGRGRWGRRGPGSPAGGGTSGRVPSSRPISATARR